MLHLWRFKNVLNEIERRTLIARIRKRPLAILGSLTMKEHLQNAIFTGHIKFKRGNRWQRSSYLMILCEYMARPVTECLLKAETLLKPEWKGSYREPWSHNLYGGRHIRLDRKNDNHHVFNFSVPRFILSRDRIWSYNCYVVEYLCRSFYMCQFRVYVSV